MQPARPVTTPVPLAPPPQPATAPPAPTPTPASSTQQQAPARATLGTTTPATACRTRVCALPAGSPVQLAIMERTVPRAMQPEAG